MKYLIFVRLLVCKLMLQQDLRNIEKMRNNYMEFKDVVNINNPVQKNIRPISTCSSVGSIECIPLIYNDIYKVLEYGITDNTQIFFFIKDALKKNKPTRVMLKNNDIVFSNNTKTPFNIIFNSKNYTIYTNYEGFDEMVDDLTGAELTLLLQNCVFLNDFVVQGNSLCHTDILKNSWETVRTEFEAFQKSDVKVDSIDKFPNILMNIQSLENNNQRRLTANCYLEDFNYQVKTNLIDKGVIEQLFGDYLNDKHLEKQTYTPITVHETNNRQIKVKSYNKLVKDVIMWTTNENYVKLRKKYQGVKTVTSSKPYYKLVQEYLSFLDDLSKRIFPFKHNINHNQTNDKINYTLQTYYKLNSILVMVTKIYKYLVENFFHTPFKLYRITAEVINEILDIRPEVYSKTYNHSTIHSNNNRELNKTNEFLYNYYVPVITGIAYSSAKYIYNFDDVKDKHALNNNKANNLPYNSIFFTLHQHWLNNGVMLSKYGFLEFSDPISVYYLNYTCNCRDDAALKIYTISNVNYISKKNIYDCIHSLINNNQNNCSKHSVINLFKAQNGDGNRLQIKNTHRINYIIYVSHVKNEQLYNQYALGSLCYMKLNSIYAGNSVKTVVLNYYQLAKYMNNARKAFKNAIKVEDFIKHNLINYDHNLNTFKYTDGIYSFVYNLNKKIYSIEAQDILRSTNIQDIRIYQYNYLHNHTDIFKNSKYKSFIASRVRIMNELNSKSIRPIQLHDGSIINSDMRSFIIEIEKVPKLIYPETPYISFYDLIMHGYIPKYKYIN